MALAVKRLRNFARRMSAQGEITFLLRIQELKSNFHLSLSHYIESLGDRFYLYDSHRVPRLT